jgi:hypothetical protein
MAFKLIRIGRKDRRDTCDQTDRSNYNSNRRLEPWPWISLPAVCASLTETLLAVIAHPDRVPG